MNRRRFLAVAVTIGASSLAGCGDGGAAATVPPRTDTTAPTATATGTETRTSEPAEAAIEVVEATVREETITAGETGTAVVDLRNTGDVAGETGVEFGDDGAVVATERVEVPAGGEERVTFTFEFTRPHAHGVTVDGEVVGTLTVEPPETLYVDPDGSDDDPGLADAPFATIRAALDTARPGQTIHVDPGTYTGEFYTTRPGEPGNPITITVPEDAVYTPDQAVIERHFCPITIGHSHVHLAGLTIDGLRNPEAPGDRESYAGHLVKLGPSYDTEEYVEDVVVAPHGIGNSRYNLVQTERIENYEFGPFRVIGPAGAAYLHGDERTHQGEVIYLGTPRTAHELDSYPRDTYDHTRNIHVHHVDNSAGHNHSELVDCKLGTENVTIEYCTDGDGSRINESWDTQSIALSGHQCTVRWCRFTDGDDDCLEIQKANPYDRRADEYGYTPEVRERVATKNEIYGNVIEGYGGKAIALVEETAGSQRSLCGNDVRGDTDGDPGQPCSEDLPDGDGVGRTGGQR